MSTTVTSLGPIGRLGRWAATHFRVVATVWALIAVGLGVFAPRVEHALSGAGWETSGSESVEVRETVDREFGGLSASALMVVVHSEERPPPTRSSAQLSPTPGACSPPTSGSPR